MEHGEIKYLPIRTADKEIVSKATRKLCRQMIEAAEQFVRLKRELGITKPTKFVCTGKSEINQQ